MVRVYTVPTCLEEEWDKLICLAVGDGIEERSLPYTVWLINRSTKTKADGDNVHPDMAWLGSSTAGLVQHRDLDRKSTLITLTCLILDNSPHC